MPKPTVKKPPAPPPRKVIPLPPQLEKALDLILPFAGLQKTAAPDNAVKVLIRWGNSLAEEFRETRGIYSETVDEYVRTVTEWWDWINSKEKPRGK